MWDGPQPTVGDTTPRQMGQGCISNIESKSVSSVLLWFLPCSPVLASLGTDSRIQGNTLSPPELLWVTVFATHSERRANWNAKC